MKSSSVAWGKFLFCRIKELNTSSTNVPDTFNLFIVTVISTLFEQDFFSDVIFYETLDENIAIKYEVRNFQKGNIKTRNAYFIFFINKKS